MPKIKKSNKIVSKHAVIAGLLTNLVLPGLGTIILGKYDIGTIQIILSFAGILFSVTPIGAMIGLSLFIVIWIWALIVGIQALKPKKA